jgi:site-specific recombinase XerD
VKKKTSDILLWHLDKDFVLDFAAFLRIEYKLDTNSSEKLMRIFKRITTMCFKNGQMPKDPFCEHKIKKVKKDRGYLTKHELDKILEYTPDCKRMEKVRDIFVFCCFTGLDYSTVASLRDTDIVIGDDSSLWIYKDRVKTGIQSRIKLLSIPLAIIKKYEETKSGSYVLPVMSNAKYNAYLKELAEGCGIEKKITTHLARHTFATTVTLANGVPIETVSKMLGHTKITTTQIYARAIDKKVSDDMDSLAKKLETAEGFAFAG